MAAGQALTGTYNAAAPGDTITVRYATTNGDGILNCLGQSNTERRRAAMYTNVFSVVNGQLLLHAQRHRAVALAGTAPVR